MGIYDLFDAFSWLRPTLRRLIPLVAEAHEDRAVVQEILRSTVKCFETRTRDGVSDKAKGAREKHGVRPTTIILAGPLEVQWLAYWTSADTIKRSVAAASPDPTRSAARRLHVVLAQCFRSVPWLALGIGQYIYDYDLDQIDAMLTIRLRVDEWQRNPERAIDHVQHAWPQAVYVEANGPVERVAKASSVWKVNAWNREALRSALTKAFENTQIVFVRPALNQANRRSKLGGLLERLGLESPSRECSDGECIDALNSLLRQHAPFQDGLSKEFILEPVDLGWARRNRAFVDPDEFARLVSSIDWSTVPAPATRLRTTCIRPSREGASGGRGD